MLFFKTRRFFKRGAGVYDYQDMIFIYERFVCIVAVMIFRRSFTSFPSLLFRLSFAPVSVQFFGAWIDVFIFVKMSHEGIFHEHVGSFPFSPICCWAGVLGFGSGKEGFGRVLGFVFWGF